MILRFRSVPREVDSHLATDSDSSPGSEPLFMTVPAPVGVYGRAGPSAAVSGNRSGQEQFRGAPAPQGVALPGPARVVLVRAGHRAGHRAAGRASFGEEGVIRRKGQSLEGAPAPPSDAQAAR